MLASIFSVADNIGIPLIFLIVVIETGCGIPFAPGEIAVVTGGILASQGKYPVFAVMATAAAAAIIGDNIGYLIGRSGGRALLEKPGLFARQRRAVLTTADPFFERHGSKAVFIGRWLPIMRVYASWLAGGARMPWRTFFLWNAAGGICWAISMSLWGYFVGASAKKIIHDIGIYGIAVVVLGGIAGIVITRRLHRRQNEKLVAAPVEPDEARPVPIEPRV